MVSLKICFSKDNLTTETINERLNIRNLLERRIEMIEDQEQIYKIARLLSYKFTNDEEYIEHEIQKSGPGTMMFALVPEHMTGKLVKES